MIHSQAAYANGERGNAMSMRERRHHDVCQRLRRSDRANLRDRGVSVTDLHRAGRAMQATSTSAQRF